MIRFAVNQWDKNKQRLKNHIENNIKDYEDCRYKKLVEDVTKYIFNDEEERFGDIDNYDHTKITEIDNGDYQGTFLYLIPTDSYQPSSEDYLMTNVSYGSCSGCDTLLSLQYDISDLDEEWNDRTEGEREEIKNTAVDDLMTLCLHLVQNTIRPYNIGYSANPLFDSTSDNDSKFEF